MEMVGHDEIGMKQIRNVPVVLENFLHQYRPSVVTKEWLPLNSLRGDKVCLSVSPDCFSGWPHIFPQWLKPLGFNLQRTG